ncbi:MAG: hypothetical protein HPY53_01125 [Brevinematales bacterium]|nr:hypothetical protein [Brevinematales bacterium]
MMYKEDYKNGKIEQKDYLLQEKLNLNNIEKINKEISELKNKKDVYMTTLETNSQLDIKKGNNVFVKLSEGFNSLGLNTSSEGIRIFLLALFSFIIECGFLFTMYIDIIGKKKLFGEKEPDSTMNENNPLLSKLPAENIKPRIIQESRRKESTVRVSQITDKELFLKFVIDLYNGEDKPAKLQSDNDMRDKGFPARMVREYKMLMKDIVIKDPITGIKKSIIKVNAGWMGIEPLVSLSELTDFIKDDSFSLDIKDGKLIAYPTSSYPLNGNDSPVNNSESDYLPDGTKNNPEIARYFPGIKDRVLKN